MSFNYSNYWFENVSLEELEVEREKVRLAWCNREYTKTLNNSEIQDLQNLLWRFDDFIRIKKYDNDDKVTNLPKSQHGWYLPEDD
jgi:hypothetical protein